MPASIRNQIGVTQHVRCPRVSHECVFDTLWRSGRHTWRPDCARSPVLASSLSRQTGQRCQVPRPPSLMITHPPYGHPSSGEKLCEYWDKAMDDWGVL